MNEEREGYDGASRPSHGHSTRERQVLELREAAIAYEASPALRVVRGTGANAALPKGGGKMKTSVYLDPVDVSRLSWLADVEGRPQAEIIRDAIRIYRPQNIDREFAVFRGVTAETASAVDLAQEDIERLMEGFGDDGTADNDR